jgi:hypothetical protein
MYPPHDPAQVTATFTAAIERYRQDAPSLTHPSRTTTGPQPPSSSSTRSTAPQNAATPQGFLFLGKQVRPTISMQGRSTL